MAEDTRRSQNVVESIPLSDMDQPSSSTPPSLTRQPSVMQSVRRFVGVEDEEDEVQNSRLQWDLKRLRHRATKNNLNQDEVRKYLKDREMKGVHTFAVNDDSSAPMTPDIERGMSFVSQNPQGRQSVENTSQTNLSRLSRGNSQLQLLEKRESIPSAMIDSVSSLFKKGSLINKRQAMLRNSFSTKFSFDFAGSPHPESPLTSPPSSDRHTDESPSGIVLELPKTEKGESYEMTTFKKSKKLVEKEDKIAEESTFEAELCGEEDEAEEVDMDPTAMTRMTAKVRKKSSVTKPRSLSRIEGLTRPSDLSMSTRPLTEVAKRFDFNDETFREESRRRLTEKRSQFSHFQGGIDHENDPILSSIQSSSEEMDDRRRALLKLQNTVLSDEVFFDEEITAPEVEEYHPDIARSPPPSAALSSPKVFRFDPSRITIAEVDPSTGRSMQQGQPAFGYRQEQGISYVDVGDSHIHQPAMTRLGRVAPTDQMTSQQTDRPSSSVYDAFTIPPPTKSARLQEIERELAKKRLLKQRREQNCSKVAVNYRQKVERRKRGIGRLGRFFDRKLNNDLPPDLKLLLDSEKEHVPWFYYWVTTSQTIVFLLVMLLSIPDIVFFGGEFKEDVLDITLTQRKVSYKEPANFFIGPRFADLILFGAKYTPCMRRETKLWKEIEEDRKAENKTGCCSANDKSGCWQTSKLNCPLSYAHWIKWDKEKKLRPINMLDKKSKSESDLLKGMNMTIDIRRRKIRKSGAVCGQDPDYCEIPASVDPYEWPDDITKWPICEKRHEGNLPEHMTCKITGRPCCIQIQGTCRIATQEYCKFVKGFYHENATLCSQVNCFKDVCGMAPFVGETPSQYYRLFTSLFLHAGIVQYVFSMIFQYWLVEDFEKMIGSKRMAILYIASGVGGNLASAIFVPFMPGAGPSGSQSGVLAAHVVEVYYTRSLIEEVDAAFVQHGVITITLFAMGLLLPYLDNWANLFGTIFGALITIVIFPYIDFEKTTQNQENVPQNVGSRQEGYRPLNEIRKNVMAPLKKKRTYVVLTTLIVTVLLFAALGIILFSNIRVDWHGFTYFNCFPLFVTTCDNQGHTLKKMLPI